MSDNEKKKDEEALEDEELERQEGEALPDREVMSVIDGPTGPPTFFPGPDDPIPPAS
jgi:hypothetical protein